MKILCVSDRIDSAIYSPNIKSLFGDVDMVLAAGDLSLEYLEFIVSSLNKPLYFVFGNHHLELLHSEERANIGATDAGWKVVRSDEGLLIAGAPGSMLYNGGENQFSERQMAFNLFRMIPRLLLNRLRYGRYLDILLTHAAPAGIHDRPDLCHKGFACFLRFCRRFRPKYLIHGHIHLYDLSEPRSTRYLDTSVVNAFGHIVIDLPT